MEKYKEINFEDFRSPGSKVFTGRDRGKIVRDESKIDEIESNYDKIVIIVPEDIYSINPSFFEELFINVIKKLGKEGFHNKFEFIFKGDYDGSKQLNEAIDRILRRSTALD